MRHASWDVVMAGGYLVTGFGTTYFGGNRDPGPFDVAASKNDGWEQQIGFIKRFFTELDWWKLQPRDGLLSCSVPRGRDTKHLGRTAPPATTYWLLANPDGAYLIYARGVSSELTLTLGSSGTGRYCIRLFNPRSGVTQEIENRREVKSEFVWTPPTADDWVLCLEAVNPAGG